METLFQYAVRVADRSVDLLYHDEACRAYDCTHRDGCEVRKVLMEALNEATNDYDDARRAA